MRGRLANGRAPGCESTSEAHGRTFVVMKSLSHFAAGWLGAILGVVRAIVAGIRLVRDPDRLPEVFVLDRAVTGRATLEKMLGRLRGDPRAAAALASRERVVIPPLAELASLPAGTLGRAFADFMLARGLDPASIPRVDSEDDATFVRQHLYETHDLWHVVTGFDTDVPGELGLQAFYSAQLDGALPRFLMVGGLLNTRRHGRDEWADRVDAMARGWHAGRRADLFFGVRWASMWERPLTEVRRGLGVRPEGDRPTPRPVELNGPVQLVLGAPA